MLPIDNSTIESTFKYDYSRSNNSITFTQNISSVKYVITVISNDLIRVRVWPKGSPVTTRTWSVVEESSNDVPFDGNIRHNDKLHDSSNVFGDKIPTIDFTVHQDNNNLMFISTANLKLEINLCQHFAIAWKTVTGNNFIVAKDNPIVPYQVTSDRYHRHTLCRFAADHYYGLGEKSGPLDKCHRRYRMRNTDALAYNAELSDPLYKHIPFYITLHDCHAYGIFYDTTNDCTFDMGCEVDNYYGNMRYFESKDVDIDYYFINGPSIQQVVERYTKLTGRPPLAPK